jgi:hypothetical protein
MISQSKLRTIIKRTIVIVYSFLSINLFVPIFVRLRKVVFWVCFDGINSEGYVLGYRTKVAIVKGFYNLKLSSSGFTKYADRILIVMVILQEIV